MKRSLTLSRHHKRALLALAIALLAGTFGLSQSELKPLGQLLEERPQPGYYRVVKVEDGDTITVFMNHTEERVRLIGVDTPETQHPEKPVQCFGKAATDFTRQLIAQYDVRLEADPEDDNRDIYGRLLRYVYLPDGRLVNAEIIAAGYGFAYTRFPFTKLEELRKLQFEAREAGRGLWSQCTIDETDDQPETRPA